MLEELKIGHLYFVYLGIRKYLYFNLYDLTNSVIEISTNKPILFLEKNPNDDFIFLFPETLELFYKHEFYLKTFYFQFKLLHV